MEMLFKTPLFLSTPFFLSFPAAQQHYAQAGAFNSAYFSLKLHALQIFSFFFFLIEMKERKHLLSFKNASH